MIESKAIREAHSPPSPRRSGRGVRTPQSNKIIENLRRAELTLWLGIQVSNNCRAANQPDKSGQNPNSGHLAKMARIRPKFQALARKR